MADNNPIFPGDPTPRTLESQAQAIASLEKVLSERITAITEQLRQFRQDITTVPTEVDKRVEGLDKLMLERFKTVDVKFNAIDQAIPAALNAQKEMGGQLNASNQAAITKAEQGMSAQIKALEALLRVEVNALRAGVIDNSSRISTIVDRKGGQTEQRDTSQGNQLQLVGIVGLVAAILFGTVGAFIGIATSRTETSERIIERVVEVAPTQRAPTIVIPPSP